MLSPTDLGVEPELTAWTLYQRVAVSAVLILLILGLRWLIVNEIRRRAAILSDRQRWWITVVKNFGTLAILIGLFAIWAPEIQDFALSITAFALALVIATKELLLSISGAIWRGTTAPFQIGDWVEIGEHNGEVIDENLLVTTLQEINREDFRYTGRSIAVPNGLLLNTPVINHNFRKRFILHEFTLVSEPSADVAAVRAAVQEAMNERWRSFAEVAGRYAAVIEKNSGMKLPQIEPSVCLGTTDLANVTYRCCVFCPRERANEIEQAAAAAFAQAIRRERPAAEPRLAASPA